MEAMLALPNPEFCRRGSGIRFGSRFSLVDHHGPWPMGFNFYVKSSRSLFCFRFKFHAEARKPRTRTGLDSSGRSFFYFVVVTGDSQNLILAILNSLSLGFQLEVSAHLCKMEILSK